jgi:hypothetical protein
VARDEQAHAGHRLTAEKLSKKLDTVRSAGGAVLFLHERDLDDATLASVLGDPVLPPLPTVKLLQLQNNPRLTSAALSVVARVAAVVLPALEEIILSYTAVTDLSPLAGVRTLRSISAIVGRPQGLAELAALPKLREVTLSTGVSPADLAALRRAKRCSVKQLQFHEQESRFGPDCDAG